MPLMVFLSPHCHLISDRLHGFVFLTLPLKRKDWKEAEYVIDKCIESYPPNENASVVKAMIERKRGQSRILPLAYSMNSWILDPLNHFARFEKYLNTGSETDKNDFVHFIRQELPQETYIEMAIQYYEWNMEEEAFKIARTCTCSSDGSAMAGLAARQGRRKIKAEDKLILAMAASPELVFPFRTEMTELFSWANEQKPDWKWRYYEALIHWQNNQTEAARSLFNSCGNEPDFVPFYLAKAELFSDDSALAGAALEKSIQAGSVILADRHKADQYYVQEKQPEKALDISREKFQSPSFKLYCRVAVCTNAEA